MNGKELLLTRRSVRRFTDELVSRETIEEIVEMSKYAPSWKNFQIARYNIIENRDILDQIASIGVNNFIYNAKTLMNAKQLCVLSYKKDVSGKLDTGELATSKKDWDVFDAGIATLQFCLAAHEKGVGTVIMGIFDDETISKILNLPTDEQVGALIVFGYPKYENPDAPKRKDLDTLLRYIK